jgi:1-acyl-sn-glycerol-3-phosphate acyltransferase
VPTGLYGLASPLVYGALRRARGEREAQRAMRRAVHRYCRLYFPILCTIVPPLEVTFHPPAGVRRVPGRGAVYVANHSGTLDIVFLLAHVEDFHILGKEDLARVPVFGWALSSMGVVFTERSNRFEARDVYGQLCELVRSGESILTFPQGHRLPEWRLRDIKRGIFRVALETGAPVIPVAIVNSRRFLEPHQFWFDITTPVRGHVVARPAIVPRGDPDDPRDVSRLRREVHASIQEALDRYGSDDHG